MKLTKEQYESLDESLRGEFELQGDVYVSLDELKVAGLKESLNNLDSKMKAEKAAQEAETQRLIEEAREQALEEAKSKNNVDEILRLEREKLEDEEKRINSQREELTSIKQELANDKLNNVIDQLSNHVVSHLQPAFKRIIKAYIDVNIDTREVTYLNEDGSASSLNTADFVKDLAERDTFKPFMKASLATDGKGILNGDGGGSTAAKNPKEMNSMERLEFKKRDPEGFKRAFNL